MANEHGKPIILLDLMYTLVENSRDLPYPQCDFEKEQYRVWLLGLLTFHYVILITARMEKYKAETLENIKLKTGWTPKLAFFNDGCRAPEFKRKILINEIRPIFPDREFLAIESNPRTRAMYHDEGIKTCKIYKGDLWDQLPAGGFSTLKPKN